MIEIEEARYAVSVARQYADEGRYDVSVEVLEKLLAEFPPHYRFGQHVLLALDATDYVDWNKVETDILCAVNSLIVDELRRRDKLAADNRAKASKPRTSKYAWMQEIAKEMAAARPKLTDNHLAELILDRIQTEADEDKELPSDRTVRNWLKKIRDG